LRDSMNENITWHSGSIKKEDREKLLNQKGEVIWFTGLSGSGKSTIAVELEKELFSKGRLVYRLDGDNIRHGLNNDLGFSNDERKENIRRISEVAKLMQDAGLIVLASFITPFKKTRETIKDIVGEDNLKIVYVKADVDTCSKRDPKGLYEKAKKGEIDNFTGISSPYEIPKKPYLIVDTKNMSLEESVDYLLEHLEIQVI